MYKYFILIACMMFFYSCSEENNREPVTSDSTIPGQVSNVRTESLPGAVKLTYDLPSGQNLSYVKAECLINGVVRQVKASSYINNLTIEGFADELDYTVNLYSINRSEKGSEPVAVTVRPLSPNFREVFKNIQLVGDWGGATLYFENPNEADLAFNIIYEDSLGFWTMGETFYSKRMTGQFSLRGLPPKETRFGVYIRDRWGNTSDTLVRDLTPRFEKELNKTNFREMFLPGDTRNLTVFLLQYLWHPSLGYEFITDNTGQWPPSFTFDTGCPQGALLSRIRLWQRIADDYISVAYNDRTARLFEVWGSMDPNPDGSWDSWTLLLDGEIIKPSGLPIGTNSVEDMEAWRNGHDVDFPLDIPYVRYIRMICKETWGKTTTNFVTSGLTLYGQEPSDIQ